MIKILGGGRGERGHSGEGPEGSPNPEGWGPARFFFPSPTTSFALFLSHWGASRGFLVVFGSARALKCARLEFSGCCGKPPRPRSLWVSHDSPRAQRFTFEGPRLHKPPKFNEKTPKRGKNE